MGRTKKGGGKKKYGLAIALLLTALLRPELEAQTHPCDQPPAPSPTISSGAPHRVAFCSLASEGVQAALVRVDGTPFDLVPVSPQTQPNATGKIQYVTGQFLQVPRGTHTMTVAAYNTNAVTGQPQLGAASAPFTFAAVDDTPLPAAPDVKAIIR